MFAEIFLRRKDYATALYYAEQAEQFAQGPNLGRVYAVLGRISANSEEVDIEIGQNWFELAFAVLEKAHDWYGLARAKSNLAALYIQQGQYLDDAEELLLEAQKTQTILSDRAGLIYTTHNIEILNNKKWIDET